MSTPAWLRRPYRHARRILGLSKPAPRPQPPPPRSLRASVPEDAVLDGFLVAQAARRVALYPSAERPQLISFLTSAYDTPPAYLAALARSLFEQDAGCAFEWVLLDNGSTRADTRSLLAALGTHPCVTFGRVPDNLGIIGGMRWCLEHARGDYVSPLDSDDVLSADCLRVLTSFLEIRGLPEILYTDEAKINDTAHFQAYFKPDWDPVLFVRSCYIAHLTAFRRDRALALGCYDDPAVEGSHDWDTFVRFIGAGHAPAHVPEVLYSWRFHAASTAADFRTKPYVFDSQRRVLEKWLAARPTRHRYEVVPDPLFPGAPDWTFRAIDMPTDPPIASVPLGDGGAASIAALRAAVDALPPTVAFVHLLDRACQPIGEAWRDEALTLFDLHPDTAMVGGRLHDGATIVSAGYVFGFGEPAVCPDKGRAHGDPGFFAQLWKTHSVAAVSPRHAVVRRAFLSGLLDSLPAPASLAYLGVWLGAAARQAGARVIYSPHVEAVATGDWDDAVTPEEKRRVAGRFGITLEDRVGYGTTLQRVPGEAFLPGYDDVPLAHRPSYPEWIGWEIERRLHAPPAAAASVHLSVLTTVYEKTDEALFDALHASIAAQTVAPLEWIVLAHGPIAPALSRRLDDLERQRAARVLRLETNRGIGGGLRYCIEHATGDWVTPVDADDLLTPDAVALIGRTLAGNPAARILYSDEDAIADGEPMAPFFRPGFDPVLLACQSYINHAIVFDRQLGLTLGVYQDVGAEYAQDWETIRLFWHHGHQPAHLPAVIYRWRKHQASLSQSGTVFDGSIRAISSFLEKIRARAPRPALYEVAPCPIDLGIGDLHLRRIPSTPCPLSVIHLGPDAWDDGPAATALAGCPHHWIDGADPLDALADALAADAQDFVLIHGPGVALHGADGIWDAIKHLELFDDAVAVSGRLVDPDDTVLFGCPVQLPDGVLVDPADGWTLRDPVHYSLALKPHSISAACVDLMVARRAALADALRARPARLALRHLGLWVGAHAAATDRRIVYAPLLSATVAAPARLKGLATAHLGPAWAWIAPAAGVTPSARLIGLAANHLSPVRALPPT